MKNCQSTWKIDYSGFKSCCKDILWLAGWLLEHDFFCSQIWGTSMFLNAANHSFHQSQELGADCSAGTFSSGPCLHVIFTYKTKHVKGAGLGKHNYWVEAADGSYIKNFIKLSFTLFFLLIRKWFESISKTQGDCSVQLRNIQSVSIRCLRQGWPDGNLACRAG